MLRSPSGPRSPAIAGADGASSTAMVAHGAHARARGCARYLSDMSDSPAHTLRGLAAQYAEQVRLALGDRLVSIVLFGSVARGDPSPTSDLDLLIVARDLPTGQFARKRLLQAADAAFEPALVAAERQGIETRLARIVRTPQEAARPIPLYLDLTEDAVLLYDADGFFAAVLDRLRASLRRLGSRRIREGRHWYWDLKPDFRRGDVIEL